MKIVRSIAGVVVDWIVSAILITGVEIGTFIAFRSHNGKPALEQMKELEKDPKSAKAFVEALPPDALAAVLGGWAAGAFFGGGLSALIAGRWQQLHAGIIGGLVLAGVVLNSLSMKATLDYTHPAWMIIAGLLLPLPLSILAGKLAAPRTPPHAPVSNP
jgi:hypothetical protein